jgi:methylated-DNA-protein-cysteine methyltransferase-like protein
MDEHLYAKIYQVVEQIPIQQVASYGDIAQVVGGGCEARTVGYALGALPRERAAQVPWQRVISADGSISTRGLAQRELLLAEEIPFDSQDRVIMARCRWHGPDPAWAEQHGFQILPPRTDAEQLSLF